MRIRSEYISFKNRWIISSSCNFQAHQQRSQGWSCFPRPLYGDSRCSQVLPGAPEGRYNNPVNWDLSPGRREACNSPADVTRFDQSRQCRPEHPGVSDGISSCCWWCTLSWWGKESTAFSFANTGGQYDDYRWQRLIHILISWRTGRTIVDAPLTLIVMIGKGEYRILFCQWRQPLRWLWMTTTNLHFNNLTWRTMNCWCSIDAHLATRISPWCNNSLWRGTQITAFWQSFYPLHVWFHLSLHCALIVHINISFKIYAIVSANCW
jgi:hypothetical protein